MFIIILKRIIVFFIGLIIAILLLEIGLRLAGFIYRKSLNIPRQSGIDSKGKPLIILCLGNSYTKGAGVSSEMSYPAQLQRMFDQRVTGRKVVVINKGQGQQNTAELLSDLRANIKNYCPDLIVLQTGQPNSWNYLKYVDYLRKKENRGSWVKGWVYSSRELLYESHVYRLLMLFKHGGFVSQESKPPVGASGVLSDYRKEEKYLEAVNFRKRVQFLRKPVVDQRQVQQGLELFRRSIKLDPDLPQNYFEAGFLYEIQGKYEEALKWYFKSLIVALRAGSDHWVVKIFMRVRDIKVLNKGLRNNGINRQVDKLFSFYDRHYPGQTFNFTGLNKAEIEQWVRSDMREIVKIIRQKNIGLIMQNYPKAFPVNAIFPEICHELRLPLVDNYTVFRAKIMHGATEQDLFVPDSHCSVRGYGLMANNVFDAILKLDLFKNVIVLK